MRPVWLFRQADSWRSTQWTERTGKRFLSVLEAMRESGASYEEIDEQHQQMMNPFRRGNIYYRTYQAKDGTLAVACLSDRLRKRVADVLELDDPRFEPGYDPMSPQVLDAPLKNWLRWQSNCSSRKTVEEWLQIFDSVGVPAGPVRYIQELLQDEQVKANGLVVDLEHSLAGPSQDGRTNDPDERDAVGGQERIPCPGRAH